MAPLALLLALSPPASAEPEAPDVFCEVYPSAPTCAAGAVACATCHDADGPPVFNPYGDDVAAALDTGQDFAAALPAALAAVESLDSDGDGEDNLSEILAGTWPGSDSAVEPECSEQLSTDNDWYALGSYDAAFAWRRVMVDFCGRSPRYDEVQAFDAAIADGADADAEIAALLDACLTSPYWSQVLEEIGISVVEPVGQAADQNLLGNFEWDIRLFQYATSGGRDAGDLLQADYLVVEEPDYSGILVAIDDPRDDTEEYAQPLEKEHRYGLITTRYSLAMHVMFSEVPRNLTSHWYKHLLGMDLSRGEGLFPIDEMEGAYEWASSADVDGAGVWQEGCAQCHTTLDPLSYPWARYNGIDLEGNTTGIWSDHRASGILETTDGYIFGVPVSGPEQWVEEAVQSDAFAAKVTLIFWEYLLRRDPYACEADAYEALWISFRDGGRDVEAMLHELVKLEAYGQP